MLELYAWSAQGFSISPNTSRSLAREQGEVKEHSAPPRKVEMGGGFESLRDRSGPLRAPGATWWRKRGPAWWRTWSAHVMAPDRRWRPCDPTPEPRL